MGSATALAQANLGTYTVQSGDTLFVIAQRFGVSLDALVALNHIEDASLIRVGQVLLIPAASDQLGSLPTTTLQALPGETLGMFALRYAQEADLLTTLNSISITARLFPGQPIRIPANQAGVEPLRFGAVRAIAGPEQLPQGRTGRVVITTERPLSVSVDWNGLPLPLTEVTGDGLQSIVLVPAPALLAPGPYPLTLSYLSTNQLVLTHTQTIQIIDGGYETQQIVLPEEKSDLLAPDLTQSETEKVAAVITQISPTLWWSAPFTRPIGSQYETTSPFGTRRNYNNGSSYGYHAGQDFGAPAGITVTAPGAGVVVLAEPLQVRGNAVIIDHGRGIFTGYWHLSEIDVAVGQAVQAGDRLGLVGTTGRSTGAHLHWELTIDGVAVDPIQFLTEPLAGIP
ncbi:MAG: peptidoglycan DD-metalloendopeptidase family protein [Caldilineaceae bacterium]